MTAPLRAVGYARVSSTRQAAEGQSIDTQAELIARYCAGRGVELHAMLIDAAVSASSQPLASRRSGQQLARLTESGAVGLVVAWKLDRIFRNTLEALTYARRWEQLGVGLVLLDFGGEVLDTTTPYGRAMFTMRAAFAELETGITSERVVGVLSAIHQRGVYTAPTPYGYLRVPSTVPGGPRELVPDPDTAPTVREAFARSAEGEVPSRLVAEMNQRGLLSTRGGRWHQTTLTMLLRRPVYMGMLATRAGSEHLYMPAVNVAPLVTPAVWQAAQDAAARVRQLRPNQRRPRAPTLAGLLRCGTCGSRMQTSSPRGVRWYYCAARRLHCCPARFVREDVLLPVLREAVQARLDPAAIAAAAAEAYARDADLGGRLTEIELRLARLTDLYVSGDLARREYDQRAQPLRAEQAELEAALRVPALLDLDLAPADLADLDTPGLREVLVAAIDHAVVLDGHLAEVHWR